MARSTLPRKTTEYVDFIPSAACIRTAEGRVLYANAEFCSLFSLPANTSFPLNISELKGPEVTSDTGKRELSFQTTGFSFLSLSESYKAITPGRSGEWRCLSVFAEISAAAINYYETYKKLLQYSPDIIVIVQEDEVVFVNEAAVRFLERTDAFEVIGKKIDEIAGEEQSADFEVYLRALKSGLLKKDYGTVKRWFTFFGKKSLLEVTGSIITFAGERAMLLMARDHTQEALADEDIRKSNERFRVLFEESRDPILIIDGAGIFRDCNKAAFLTLGYSDKTGIVGKTPEDISPSTQGNGMSTPDAAMIQITKAYSEGHHQFEWLHQKADGTPVPFTISLTRLDYENESFLLVHWYNLTARLLVEEELKKDREQLATIMNTIVDGVALVNRDGRFTYTNKAAEKILDVEPDELLGTFFIDNRWQHRNAENGAIDREDLPLAIALRNEKEIYAHEHKINTGKSESKWISVNAAPLYSRSGMLTGAVASFRDITKELEAKQSLQESLLLSDSVLSSLQANIAVIDNTGMILAINNAWRKFAIENGAENNSSVLPGVNYFDTYLPYSVAEANPPAVYDKIRSVLDGSLPEYSEEYRCDSPTEIRWFRMSVFPLVSGKGAVIAHENITSRKLIEEELKQKEALLSSFFNSSSTGMIIVDKDFEVLQVNEQLSKITGYNETEWAGQNLKEIEHHFAAVHRTHIENVLTGGKAIFNLEMRVLDVEKAGREKYWLLSYFPISITENETIAVGGVITDVTELKQTQYALEDSEWKFRQLFDSSFDGVVSTTLSGQITLCNPAFERLTGYKLIELKQMNVRDITPAKYHKPERSIFREKVLLNGFSGLYEKEYIRKDGSEFPAEISMYLETDKRGKPSGAVGFVRDISERKKQDEALKENEQRFRAIFENSADAILLTSNGIITFANPAFYALFEYSPKDFFGGANYLSLMHTDDRERVEQLMTDANLGEGEKTNYECEGLKKSGVTFTMNVLASSYQLLGSTFVLMVMRDVTVQRQMEALIHESELNLRAVLDAVQDSILLIDRNGTILSLNQMAAAQLQSTPQHLIGRILYDVIKSEDPATVRAQLEEVMQKGKILNQEFYRQGHWYQRVLYPVYHQDGYTKVAIYVADITERKENEVSINSMNDQLRNHVMARDKFFSIIAHDLKSPYMGILGLMEILLDDEEKPSGPELDKYLKDLRNALHKQYELIQNLLEWSRIQTGKKEYHPEALEVRSLTEEVYDSLKLTAGTKEISIERFIAPGMLIWADPHMVRSILINLLGNAIKFSHSRSEITIKAYKKGDFVEITVQDYGTGMSQEHLNKLFDLSASKSKEGTSGEKGTGLGLLITKEMAELQGGILTATSTEGRGSIFKVLLPVYVHQKLSIN